MRKRNPPLSEKPLKTVTIYKLGKKSKILTFSIEIDGSKYRTVTGVLGEETVCSAWRQAKPKNIGKKTETTAEGQAMLEACAKIDVKLGMGYSKTVEEATNAKEDKLLCTLAHKWEDYQYRLSNRRLMVSYKLDGMRCLATKDGLFSRNGKPITSCPHVEEALSDFFANNPSIVLDGELYNHDYCHNFNKIIGALKRQNCDAGVSLGIRFHVFDYYDKRLVSTLDEPVFSERDVRIAAWFSKEFAKKDCLTHVEQMKPEPTDKLSEGLERMMSKALANGYEGLMIRDALMPYCDGRSPQLLKFKQFDDAEFCILEVLEGEGGRSNMAGKVLCSVTCGSSYQTFEVGIKGGVEFYKQLWRDRKSLVGKAATIRYQNLTPRGVPRFGVLTSIRDYE